MAYMDRAGTLEGRSGFIEETLGLGRWSPGRGLGAVAGLLLWLLSRLLSWLVVWPCNS